MERKWVGLLTCMALFCGSLLNGCGSGPGAGDARMAFEDTIPCAACPGIIMNVQFDTGRHSCIRTMTYLEVGSGEQPSEPPSLMRISYAVVCLKKHNRRQYARFLPVNQPVLPE